MTGGAQRRRHREQANEIQDGTFHAHGAQRFGIWGVALDRLGV